MKEVPYGILIACLLLAVTGCQVAPGEGGSGVMAMAPFVDDTFGVRGMAPVGGLSDKSVLLQQSFSLTLEEAKQELIGATDLTAFPEAVGTYRGAHLLWQLYEFETRVAEAGPWYFRVHMGLAQEGDTFYNVVLLARISDYADNQDRFLAAYEHALYALEPTVQDGRMGEGE